jgi:hypothetical protein
MVRKSTINEIFTNRLTYNVKFTFLRLIQCPRSSLVSGKNKYKREKKKETKRKLKLKISKAEHKISSQKGGKIFAS